MGMLGGDEIGETVEDLLGLFDGVSLGSSGWDLLVLEVGDGVGKIVGSLLVGLSVRDSLVTEVNGDDIGFGVSCADGKKVGSLLGGDEIEFLLGIGVGMSLGLSDGLGDAEGSAIRDCVVPAAEEVMICGVAMGWVLARDAAGV